MQTTSKFSLRFIIPLVILAIIAWFGWFHAPHSPPVVVGLKPMVVHFYTQGHVTGEQTFPPHSPQSLLIQNLIDGKQGRWSKSYNSYAPQIHIDCGYNTTITFVDNAVILNYSDFEGRPWSLIAPLTLQEYQSVRAIQHSSTTQPS